MSPTHKLHAIFHDKARAQSAREIMIKSGAFSRSQLFLVEVPTLIDAEKMDKRSRSLLSRIGARLFTGAMVGAAVALAGVVSFLLVQSDSPISSPYRALSVSAAVGALGGVLIAWTLSLRGALLPRAASANDRRSNWVLVAHAHSEREASLGEELLASSRLPRKLRVRPNGSPMTPMRRPTPTNDERCAFG